MPKYSIITIAMNQVQLTSQCIESIKQYTQDYELIIVNNNSSDGTVGYLDNLDIPCKVVTSSKNLNFSEANNAGLKVVDPTTQYVIFLNNDTVVSPNWLSRMEAHFTKVPLKHIAAVGPVCNMSNGQQMVSFQNSEEWYQRNKGRWVHTGILYGWCLMIRKGILDKIGGFDENFQNGHEDNDFSLRIQLAGYKLIIAYDTYISHLGQGTLRNFFNKKQYLNNGIKNYEYYCRKWYDSKPKKLVAVYRTSWGVHLEESLIQTSKFADHIILHFCRSEKSSEEIEDLKKKFPKIKTIGIYNGIFQEDYERNWLLQEALKLHEKGEADWCISIDDDEIYEDKFIDRVQMYMSPRNPEVLGYWCHWRTIWEVINGEPYYRADSTFGHFTNYRFFRLIKNQEITSSHPEGHHCGSAPIFAGENLVSIAIRVKHLGYDSWEQRYRKFEFYQKNDNFKRKADIGYDDYHHLIDRNVKLEKYETDNSISLIMMIKDEQECLLDCLEMVKHLVDEYVIVDTGSTDNTREIIKEFSKYSPVPVKVINYPWESNYSTPRNLAKFHATGKWILMLDADERFAPADVMELLKYTESDYDAITFHVVNYMEEPKNLETAKYASTMATRLYRNIPEFFYTGIVHETIDDSYALLSKKKKVNMFLSPVVLHHYGYLKRNETVEKKLETYIDLNYKQIEITEESDPRPFFNLALHYLSDKDEKLALSMFQKTLEIRPNFHLSLTQMAALNIKSAKTFLNSSIKHMPENHPFQAQARKVLKFLNENSFGCLETT